MSKYLSLRELGLTDNATVGEARSAYRRLATQHHPDKGGNVERFRRVAEAWVFLKDTLPEFREDEDPRKRKPEPKGPWEPVEELAWRCGSDLCFNHFYKCIDCDIRLCPHHAVWIGEYPTRRARRPHLVCVPCKTQRIARVIAKAEESGMTE